MKLVLLLLLLLLTRQAAVAQGTVFFYNHVVQAGLDAPVFDTDMTTALQGSQFQAQLYAGPSASTLAPVGSSAVFGTQPGYWTSWSEPLDRIIPDVAPGDIAFCQVRVWSYLRGSNYEQVAAANGKHGESIVFSVTTGGLTGNKTQPPGFPGYLSGLQSFALTGIDPVPEPATAVLLVTGVGLWWIVRKRRTR